MSEPITDTQRAALAQLMVDCAKAMGTDAYLTVDGDGVNAFEVSPALQAVADILNIPGPRDALVDRTVAGRYQLDPIPVAVMGGPPEADHTGCRAMRSTVDGSIIRCMGWHCGVCGKPSSERGHAACREVVR